MRLRLLSCLPLAIAVLWASQSLAEPWTLSCRGAITKLARVQKAVQVKQREVQAAERGKRVALAEAEVCKPGGIVTGDRMVKCARMSQKVPMAVRAVAEAEADLQPALEKFEEALDTINRRCLEVR